MRGYNHSKRRGEYTVVFYDGLPWWRRAVERSWEFLCWVTRGIVGGHGAPEWLWKIPVGRPKREEDGWLINSVAAKLHDLESYILSVADTRPYEVVEVVVTADEMRKLSPDFVDIFEEEAE